MRVLLASVGTRGDVQPLAVLGAALARAGHEVKLAAPPDTRPLAEERALPFVACGSDFTRYIAEIDVARVGAWRVLREFESLVVRDFAEQAPIIGEAARGCDVVVAAGLQPLALSAADAAGARATYVYFAPSLVPSRHHPPMLVPWQRMPAFVNRLLHAATAKFLDRAIMPLINRFRAQHSLPAHARYVDALPSSLLFAWDRAIAPAPPDFADMARAWRRPDVTYEHVGALQPAPAPLPDDVERFIAAPGAPPCVYVGFGSMPQRKPGELRALVAQAAQLAGVRVLVAASEGESDDVVMRIGAVSHATLFARCRAIVHHCGAGTTATAARAGVPQVAVPHFVDQPYWALRLEQLGVSAATLPRAKLSAAALGRALKRCVDDGELQQRARALGAELGATDPLAAAVQAVERIGARR